MLLSGKVVERSDKEDFFAIFDEKWWENN